MESNTFQLSDPAGSSFYLFPGKSSRLFHGRRKTPVLRPLHRTSGSPPQQTIFRLTEKNAAQSLSENLHSVSHSVCPSVFTASLREKITQPFPDLHERRSSLRSYGNGYPVCDTFPAPDQQPCGRPPHSPHG